MSRPIVNSQLVSFRLPNEKVVKLLQISGAETIYRERRVPMSAIIRRAIDHYLEAKTA